MNKTKKISVIYLLIALICIFTRTATSQVTQVDINELGLADSNHKIGADAEGNIVVIWEDHRHASLFYGDESATSVYGQIFDADLKRKGNNIRISSPVENGLTRNPDLLVLDDGKFVVVWTESKRIIDDTGEEQRIRRIVMTMLNMAGETIIPETTVNDNTEPVPVSGPQVDLLTKDSFLINWSDGRGGIPYQARYGQYYQTDGIPLGSNIRINPEGNTSTAISVHNVNQNEYFLSFGGIHSPDGQWIQYYNEDHQPIGDLIKLEQPGHLYPFGMDSILVLFFDPSNLDFDEQYYQFLNPDGTILSQPELIYDPDVPGRKIRPEVARNVNDGSFMITWTDARNGWPSTISDIYTQRFDASGDKIGMNFKVNHEPREKHQNRPQILYLDNNTYVIAWWENRLRLCIPGLPGPILNIRETLLVARIVDFDDPLPGKVWGLENYSAYCDDYERPESFVLRQNYPNPFNHSTNIVLDVNTSMRLEVTIEIYDIMGRKVREIFLVPFGRGTHEITFSATGLASGQYIARMSTPQDPGNIQIIRLLLIK
jgi:hypothetical protein